MRIARLIIENYRGIKKARILLPKHGVLIGDNNIGKTTILEALDLVLGPDRLNRQPPIDEHDFFRGQYTVKTVAQEAEVDDASEDNADTAIAEDDAQTVEGREVISQAPRIEIEVTVADLTEEQMARFGDYIEFWDTTTDTFYDQPNPAVVSLHKK
jgi:putative ATP-dependent endonuclease of OLD family